MEDLLTIHEFFGNVRSVALVKIPSADLGNRAVGTLVVPSPFTEWSVIFTLTHPPG